MMTTAVLTGYVTETGELQVELPEDFPAGKVKIRIEPVRDIETTGENGTQHDNERPYTDEEIKEMLTPHPKTGAEIAESDAVGGWEHIGITDSIEFIEELRRKRREQRRWPQL